ncbi:MAG: ABC transporter ATP-binding protein [Casimicrobiaceae bacterium]
MTDTALLRSVDLAARYGHVEALRPTDIEVAPGEFVAVLGPNGAGKSTLMRALMRLIPSSGRVFFDGKPIDRLPAHALAKLGCTLVPESRGILGPMTVRENLELGAYSRGASEKAAVEADFESVMEVFPLLKERLNQMAGSLSGGEQQMLAVGRALMVHPRLLLLDEPSLGLAPRIAAEIFKTLGQLNDRGLTILVVEQKAPLALTLADRAFVMRNGRVIASPRPEEICSPEALAHLYLGEVDAG